MPGFGLVSATQNTGGKTVIEIPSDDSDGSDVDLDSDDGEVLETADADGRPPDISSATSSPTTTTSAAPTPNSTESRHPPTMMADPSSDEDLKSIFKAARKAKAQSASGAKENAVPVRMTPAAIPPVAHLSSGLQKMFGDQVERTRNFFNPSQVQSPELQAEAAPHDQAAPEDQAVPKDRSNKRKAPHDPFVFIIVPEAHEDSEANKKKRSEKRQDQSSIPTSQASNSTTQQVPGHAPTNITSQGPKGQVNRASSRRQSLTSTLAIRPRATSVDLTATSTGRHKCKPKQRVTSRNTGSTTVFPTPSFSQPGHVVINIDDDDDTVQLSGANQAPIVPATKPAGTVRHRAAKNIIGVAGSGMLSRTTSRQRSPATHCSLRNASPDVSQAEPDDVRGYISGRPEKRPAYARQETSKWDRVVNNAKSRQAESNRIGKRTAPDKHRSRQSRPSLNPVVKARLLRAQDASDWQEAPLCSRAASRNGNATSSGLPPQHVSRTQPSFRPNKSAYHQSSSEDENDGDRHAAKVQPQPSFRPNKNAYRQTTYADAEDDDTTTPRRYSAVNTGSQARRVFKPLAQSLKSYRSSAQSAYNNDGGLADPQRTTLARNPSKALRQPQLVPKSISIPSRPQVPRPQRNTFTFEDLKRAEADMEALRKKHQKKPQAVIIDELPSGFGMPKPHEVRRARMSLAKGKAKIPGDLTYAEEQTQARRISKRKAALRRNVRRELGHESQEVQEEEVQRRFARYLEKQKQDQQPKDNPYVSRQTFNEAFLESGHNDDEADYGQDAPNATLVPAYEALETLGPNTTIDRYTVLLSEPHTDGESPKFKATKAFGQQDSANRYAHMILYDLTPPDPSSRKSKKKQQVFADVISGQKAGLFWGQGKLSSGKDAGKKVEVLVMKDEQIVGDLAPESLRSRFVDQDLLDKYARDVYEVLLFKTVPKCFEEAEQEDEKKLARRKRQEEREAKRKEKRVQRLKKRTEEIAAASEDVPTGLEGEELRHALANLSQLDTSHADVDSEVTDDEASLSDTASQASDDSKSSRGTVRASSPAGDSYDRHPQNPYADHRQKVEYHGTFTDLRKANETALSVARDEWKPRNHDMNAGLIWIKDILGYLADEETAIIKDEEHEKQLHLVFPRVQPRSGSIDHRPWGFTHSQVAVIKRVLTGPLDLATEYVQEPHEIYKGTSSSYDRVIEQAEKMQAEAAARAKAGGKKHDPEVAELLYEGNEESPDRDSSDEGDVSEEE